MTSVASTTPRLGPFETVLPPVDAAREAFATSRSQVWPDALDRRLLTSVMGLCERASFASDTVEGLGHREIERPPLAGTAVLLMLRRPPLYRWLEEVTGCAPIADVEGRVVRTWPRPGDQLDWHDDLNGERRRLGITIALGSEAYEGGVFEMRARPGKEPLIQFRHDVAGTALVFEVSWRCEHRVHPLVAGGPRQVFTGWFLG